MNKDQLQGKWKQLVGRIKQRWAKLTDDDLREIDGRADVLEGKIQELYGTSREQARKEIDEFCRTC